MNPALRGQKQTSLCEFEDYQGYLETLSQKQTKTKFKGRKIGIGCTLGRPRFLGGPAPLLELTAPSLVIRQTRNWLSHSTNAPPPPSDPLRASLSGGSLHRQGSNTWLR